MDKIARKLLVIMAVNRRKYNDRWQKVRTDRIGKLVPSGTDINKLLDFMIDHDLIKYTHKQNDDGDLVPAVQLRYEQYRAALK